MTAPLARPACQTCADAGIVFDCPLWPGCDCPGGTTRNGCPGHSKPCPDCSSGASARPAQTASRSNEPHGEALKAGGQQK